jgi:hypothetical protein
MLLQSDLQTARIPLATGWATEKDCRTWVDISNWPSVRDARHEKDNRHHTDGTVYPKSHTPISLPSTTHSAPAHPHQQEQRRPEYEDSDLEE